MLTLSTLRADLWRPHLRRTISKSGMVEARWQPGLSDDQEIVVRHRHLDFGRAVLLRCCFFFFFLATPPSLAVHHKLCRLTLLPG